MLCLSNNTTLNRSTFGLLEINYDTLLGCLVPSHPLSLCKYKQLLSAMEKTTVVYFWQTLSDTSASLDFMV